MSWSSHASKMSHLTFLRSMDHPGMVLDEIGKLHFYESLKSPREAAARQHMRQYGKIEKISPKTLYMSEFFRLFFGNFLLHIDS